jgi:TonB-dependent starch-binding outer membrane protein SusC
MRKIHHLVTGILLLVTAGLQAQTRQLITGKVQDLAGYPIPSATIRIKGVKTGTSADYGGAFTLNAPPNSILIVSGIGYETKEFRLEGSTALTVILATDSKSLSEVVVTGVGVATSKKRLGIAVESVTASKLPAAPTASIDQALVGKIAGAQISSTSGVPGAPVNILLRGINTVQGGTKPLILMDGIEVRATDINSIDLSDIERVEVVQGAASSSLYGAQGANGVIQLFTKKGKQGALSINFSSSYAANQYINTGNVHKAALHSFLTDGNNNIIDPSTGLAAVFAPDGTTNVAWAFGSTGFPSAMANPGNITNKAYNANFRYYDQFKQLFGTGNVFNNSVNISGASAKSDFALTLSNSRNLDIVRDNGYADRSNLTANMGTELFPGFRIRSITQLVYTRNTLHPGLGAPGGINYGTGNQLGANTTGGGSGIYGFLNTSPFFSLRQKLADGTSPDYQGAGTVSVNSFNPFYNEEYTSGLDNKIDIIQNFDANYKVNHLVELDAKYGINYRTEDARWNYYNQSQNLNSNNQGAWLSYYGGDNTGEIDDWNYKTTFQNFLASAFLRTDFQKDFHINIPLQTSTQVSFDYRKNLYKEYDSYGVGLPLSTPLNIQTTGSQSVARDYTEPFVTYGFLLNQKIDIGTFAGVEGGFRTDYSSNYGGGKPFTFPHVDGYFAPSELGFWQNSKLSDHLSFFKVRAAYGEAGIQPGVFQRIVTINQAHLGSSGAYTIPDPLHNPNLQVELSKELELGSDLTITFSKASRLFSSLDASFSYWTRSTSNAIYPISVPLSYGSSTQYNNAIDLRSHGYQFSLNLPVYHSKDFNWDFTTNFGHQTSIVKAIHGAPNVILNSSAGSTALVLSPGSKIGQIYGAKAFTSLDERRLDGTPYIDKASYGKYQVVNGRVVDTATKGIQFTDDAYAFGDPNPKFNVSFINGINYRFVTLTFQFDWIYGGHLYNQTKEWMYRDGLHGDFAQPVTIGGQTEAWVAYYRSAYADKFGSQNGFRNGTKDYFYESSSFLRLRNIALAFEMSQFLKVKALKKVQLVFSGRNLWTKTKYTGFDPEISSGSTNSSYDRGVDHSSLPNIKSYQVGLNVGL